MAALEIDTRVINIVTSFYVFIVNMRIRLSFLLLLCAIALPADDVSGRWSGTLRLNGPNGASQTQTIYLILNQNDGTLSGSGGNDERSQSAIRNGRATPDGIQFDIGAISVRLRLNGAALEGTGSRDGQPGMTASINLKRVQQLTMEDRIPRLIYEGSDRSSRILELRDSIETRGTSAVEEFWNDIRDHGAPLVEPIKGSDQSYLVTFLWRGSEKTRSVLLVRGRFSQFQPQNNLLSHIDGTDVWFKTLRLRRGSRFQYAFSENDPQSTLPPGKGERRSVADPLNLRHVTDAAATSGDAATSKDQSTSVLELPAALAQPWYQRRAGVPTLTLTKHRFHSEILGNERDILVYKPPGYTETAPPYPTLYLFDGEDTDGLVFASQTIENLIYEQKLAPIVVVRIANPSQAVRDRELGCLPGFTDFLARELVPFVRRTYNISSESAKTAIGGYSLGGLAAAFAGLKHSETFGLILAQSGSFWFEPSGDGGEPNWLSREFIRAPKLPLRFYIEAGTYEVDLQGRGGNILETSRDLRNVLLAKGYQVDYQEFPGDHDYVNWRGTIADALVTLFRTDGK